MTYGDTEILSFRYAGFWLRLVAAFIDTGIIALVMYLFALLVGVNVAVEQPSEADLAGIATLELAAFIIAWLYFAIMESTGAQGTLGKALMGIYVTDLDGGRISFLRGTARYWAKLLSVLPFFAGFLMILFTRHRQGLHDKIAGCLVQKR